MRSIADPLSVDPMTQLDAYESALFLARLAKAELRGKVDLRSQLAEIRLKAAIDALEGSVDMQAFEAKMIGPSPSITAVWRRCPECSWEGRVAQCEAGSDGELLCPDCETATS